MTPADPEAMDPTTRPTTSDPTRDGKPDRMHSGTPIRFETREGLGLAGDAWGDPGAPVVLLLHGGGQTRHAWAGSARALAARGHRAIVIDQRGHGESDWSPRGEYATDAYGRDLLDVIDQLGEAPTLVGASLGGIASLLAIGEAGEHVARALVLVDIATRMEPDGIQRIFEFMRMAPNGFATLEEAAEAVASYNPHRRKPSHPSGLARNLRRGEDGRWRWHWDPAFLEDRREPGVTAVKYQESLDDIAASLSLPVLLVRGRASDVLSEAGARHFLDRVPHAAYADITDAGHMVAGDRNDVFSAAVLDFLAELDAPRDEA